MLSLAALLSRGALLPFSDDEESYEPVNFGQADAADFLRLCSDTLLQINFMWAKACKEVKVAGKTEFSLTDILKSGMMG